MTTRVSFIKGATCGIGAGIAKAPGVDGNQIAATGRKPETATKAPATLRNRHPVALEVACKDQVQVPALLPVVALVFTAGGPLVYQPPSHQLA